jgi:transcriptional regulator with XRE-family HTH domain
MYSILEMTGRLKAAREKKGLSQRAFSRSIGMPQSRLSRIENGLIDLQTSSLLELSRALDLELMLIPRQAVPMVESLVRQAMGDSVSTKIRPLYHLDDEEADGDG